MAEDTNGIRPPPMSEPTPKEFTGKRQPLAQTVFAMIVWLGTVHLNMFIVLASFFFLPLHKFVLVLGILAILSIIPIYKSCPWGTALGRYICKHVIGHFPVTLHVEDYTAFNPNQAYGK
ncbi:hypothetical protein LXL04_019426 [Taraxacum kok-saghyz]